MHTGSRQVRPGVLLVMLHVHCAAVPVPLSTLQSFPTLQPHQELRIWLIWVGILESGEHLPTKAENYRSLSSVASKWKQRQMSFTEVHFGCFFPMNVEHSYACRELCSHWPIRYRSAGQRALFSFRAFSWKTMPSLHSLTAPRGWCGGEGTCRAEHITCSSWTKIGHNLRFNFSSLWLSGLHWLVMNDDCRPLLTISSPAWPHFAVPAT